MKRFLLATLGSVLAVGFGLAACSDAPHYPGGGRDLTGTQLNGQVVDAGMDAYDAAMMMDVQQQQDTSTQDTGTD